MREIIVYSLILWTIVEISNAVVRDCGSALATLDSVEVSNCQPDDARCVLHRNSNCSIKLKFTPKEDIDKIKAVVHGVIMDVPVIFPLPNSDACVGSNLVCPLKAGQSYLYEAILPVLKSYPRITVDVKWELQKITETKSGDNNGAVVQSEASNDLVCAIIPAKIQ